MLHRVFDWAPTKWHGLVRCAAVAAVLASALVAGPVVAPLAAAEPAKLALELNKLEPIEKGCRVYLVVTNSTDTGYAALKLDLALFQPDGVIGKRIAVDLAPVKPQKRTIKLFDLEGTSCDRIASVLLNDVTECRSDAGPVENCVGGLSLSSLSTVKLTK